MNMIATPFNPITKEVTGPGVPTGLTSIDQAVEILGDGYVARGARSVIYGGETARVIYSDIDYGIINC